MSKVTVKMFGTEQQVSAKDIDGQVAVAHAKLGFPVEIRIKRGNTTHVLNVSTSEAIQMQDGIAAARGDQPLPPEGYNGIAHDLETALSILADALKVEQSSGQDWQPWAQNARDLLARLGRGHA